MFRHPFTSSLHGLTSYTWTGSQVELGDVVLAESALDDEAEEVFRRRGLSLVHTVLNTRQLSGSIDLSSKAEAATQSTPLKSRLFSFRDRGLGSSKNSGDTSPTVEALMHCIAPSSGEAAEWKAALEVSSFCARVSP